jgi:hypothetical protein
MPELTRRRYRERQDCWHVYYGDVHVGTIARRVGIPPSGRPWGWICGFSPGSEPGEFRDGTAETFDLARVDFAVAWQRFSAKRTEADYQAWLRQRDWTARKYAMWKAGELLPSQKPDSMMRCPCGERFDSHRLEHNLIHVRHITAARRTDEIRR